MAKRARAYKSEKRKKELQRLKKQEQKRVKRQGKSQEDQAATDGLEPVVETGSEGEVSGEAAEGRSDGDAPEGG